MQLSEILKCLRECAPEETAMDKDPVGLLVPPLDKDIQSIVVSLDAYMPVVEAALEKSAQLIVCHHPLIYTPLKRLDDSDTISEPVMALVRAGIALYAMHTNWDRAPNGVNDTLADVLGLSDVAVLAENGIGAIARIGSLPAPLSIGDFETRIESALDCQRTSTLRHFPGRNRRLISRVAVCGGAGGSLIQDAVKAGADALVTSDVRHHEYLEAYGRDLTIFDAGHAATEEPGMRSLANLLAAQFPSVKVDFVAL